VRSTYPALIDVPSRIHVRAADGLNVLRIERPASHLGRTEGDERRTSNVEHRSKSIPSQFLVFTLR